MKSLQPSADIKIIAVEMVKVPGGWKAHIQFGDGTSRLSATYVNFMCCYRYAGRVLAFRRV